MAIVFSLFVGVAPGQMEKVAMSAFLKAAEWRVDESPTPSDWSAAEMSFNPEHLNVTQVLPVHFS